MEVKLILADYAQAADGKLNLLGAGWTRCMTAPFTPPTMGIGLLIDVAYDETNIRHELQIVLVTEDGETLTDGDRIVGFPLALEQGRPPGLVPGASQRVPLAFNLKPIECGEGRFEWQVRKDDSILARQHFSVETRP